MARMRSVTSTGAETLGDIKDVVKRMNVEKLSWDDYHAPRSIKEDLELVSQRIDPEWQQAKRSIEQGTSKAPGAAFLGREIVLFHGPPGCGKTHAMRMLASQCGLQPYRLDTKAITSSYDPRSIWGNVLQFIAGQEKAICFLDECEGVFRDRATLMTCANVKGQNTVELIDDFLEWAEGLEKAKENSQTIVCLATNMFEEVDAAVVSRSTQIMVPRPSPLELKLWWADNAMHLTEQDHNLLAQCSNGMSFRDVKKIREEEHNKAASKKTPFQEITTQHYEFRIRKFKGMDDAMLFGGAACEGAVVGRELGEVEAMELWEAGGQMQPSRCMQHTAGDGGGVDMETIRKVFAECQAHCDRQVAAQHKETAELRAEVAQLRKEVKVLDDIVEQGWIHLEPTMHHASQVEHSVARQASGNMDGRTSRTSSGSDGIKNRVMRGLGMA